MKNAKNTSSRDEFERVPLSELHQGRHGKHHDLMSEIAAQIARLPDGEAMRIPLEVVDVALPNLRSAVSRAMQARGIRIGTFSDGDNLFIWKKTVGTARYERRRPRERKA